MIRTLGLDIGSTTSKCVLLEDGSKVLASALVFAGIGTSGAEKVVSQVLDLAHLLSEDIHSTVVTGYGRNSWAGAATLVSELTCHAKGANMLFPAVRTVIDIGGQDSKVIKINPVGLMDDFLMNDKCAAGTGRFLEVMCRALQLSFEEFDIAALRAKKTAAISNTCAVFAESEVISQLASGAGIDEVAAGIAASISSRVAGLAKRVGVIEEVCMTGGVAKSTAVRKSMCEALGTEIKFSDFAQHIGALGAAIYAFENQ
jgi:predicted CoA-substrate-specific enzyme activase